MKDTPFAFTGSAARRRALFSFLALAALCTTSCRTSVLAPEAVTGASLTPQAPGSGAGHANLDPTLQTPRIVRLRNDVQNGTLVLRGQFIPRLGAPEPFYDPARPGGWMLQLFLNTDESDTG